MHGKDAVVEEILDWRPYDYVTDRTVLETPSGPIKLLHTVEFEPTTAGTTIHFRYAAPRTKREKELMKAIGPAYGAALQSGVPSLIAQLDAELAAREVGSWPRARAGGAAAGRAAVRAPAAGDGRLIWMEGPPDDRLDHRPDPRPAAPPHGLGQRRADRPTRRAARTTRSASRRRATSGRSR